MKSHRLETFGKIAIPILTILALSSCSPQSESKRPTIPTGPIATPALISPTLEVTKPPATLPPETVAPQKTETQILINNEILPDGRTFNLEIDNKNAEVNSLIQNWLNRIKFYAKNNNLEIPKSIQKDLLEVAIQERTNLADFGPGGKFEKYPKPQDFRLSFANTLAESAYQTYLFQNGKSEKDLPFQNYLKDQNKYSFQLPLENGKTMTITLDQIQKVRVILTNNSSDPNKYINIPRRGGKTQSFGYKFENGTLILLAPLDSTTMDNFCNELTPKALKNLNIFFANAMISGPSFKPLYYMPFAQQQRDRKNGDFQSDTEFNNFKIIERLITNTSQSISFRFSDFFDNLRNQYLSTEHPEDKNEKYSLLIDGNYGFFTLK